MSITDRMESQSKEFEAADLFAKQLRRLSSTPVVDDDYPEVRHAYEGALAGFIEAMKANGRFKKDNRYALVHPGSASHVSVEMKELLHSTHEIALRGGADTHWEALARGIAKLGIGPITARHYFAEGTPRETINKHLDALSTTVNARIAAGSAAHGGEDDHE